MKVLSAIILCTTIVAPVAAYADMTDTQYCDALSATYRKVVGSTASTAGGVPEAMAGCQSSPGSSIPVLEKALRDQKVDLPKRN